MLETALPTRAFALAQPGLSPEEFLDLVTLNAAIALGLRGEVGELTRRAHADLIVLRSDAPLALATETIVHSAPEISGVMIGGEWAIEPKS